MRVQELLLALVITAPIWHACSQQARHDRMQPAVPSEALKALADRQRNQQQGVQP